MCRPRKVSWQRAKYVPTKKALRTIPVVYSTLSPTHIWGKTKQNYDCWWFRFFQVFLTNSSFLLFFCQIFRSNIHTNQPQQTSNTHYVKKFYNTRIHGFFQEDFDGDSIFGSYMYNHELSGNGDSFLSWFFSNGLRLELRY